MKTTVYIDGFNLYYGAVKGTPHRWLNVRALVEKVLKPHHVVSQIKYFTARVSATPQNPNAPVRQETYLRALRSLGEIDIIFGHFLTNAARRPLADGSGFVEILKTEEKGSDVNLATHLVADACKKRFECAVVVSNDSDLCEPIRIVVAEMGLPVGVLVPLATKGRRRSRELCRVATFWRKIRSGPVGDSQLPESLEVDGQDIHKPAEW